MLWLLAIDRLTVQRTHTFHTYCFRSQNRAWFRSLLVIIVFLFIHTHTHTHTYKVTRGAVVFLYPGKSFLRDHSLSVPPKPVKSVMSNKNRTTDGRNPFYPFYNGMRPSSFPRANDSSRRFGGKGTTLTPYLCLTSFLSALRSLFFSLSLAFPLSIVSFGISWDQSCSFLLA